jgi:hypothetical protein
MSTNSDLIKKIFDDHEIEQLKSSMSTRHSLNQCNRYLAYSFYLIQSSGILVSSIAAGYNEPKLIWLGIGLNILASLVNAYEKINDNILKKLLADINAIKAGKYVDESAFIDVENKSNSTKI